MLTRPHLLARVACAVGAALLLAVLLAPRHVDLPIAWLSDSRVFGSAMNGGMPMWWAAEDLANVALFVPVGYVLFRVRRRLPSALLLGTGISAACETAQHFIPNRDGSIIDVSMNATGTLVGALAAAYGLRRARAARRSRDAALAALRAAPVDVARGGLRRLHPVQADGAVRHVEPRVVPFGDPGVPVRVVDHRSSLTRSADIAVQPAGAPR